jgi:uncharacterized protein (TIGR02145 family)
MKTVGLFFSPLCRAKSRRDSTLLTAGEAQRNLRQQQPSPRTKSRRDGILLTVCFSLRTFCLRTFSLRAILLPALLFFTCANLPAQVTIGGLEEPKSGAVLDLNSTLKGGLLLSNVVLDNLYTIPYNNTNLFPGVDTSNYSDTDVKTGFTGALVYHEGGNGIPAGIYVWNGENWSPATENCTAPVFTLTAPPFIKKDALVAFSVASDASARCAEGETYDWFQTAAHGDATYGSSFGTTASVTTSFADEGDYKVKVSATTPYSPSAIVAEKDVNVTADGGPDPAKLTSTYGIVGETCLDVKKTGQDKTAIYADRKDGFPENNYAKTYKFHHANSYSELALSLDDPGNLVAGITYPPDYASGAGEESITVTFRPEVRELAAAAPLTVKLYASYKPQEDPTETKYAYLEIRVEDGTCICPAKINTSPETWLNFMCHNLGGIDIISPSQLITYEHHGDWYRFGAKNPSLVNTGTNNSAVFGWTWGSNPTPPYYALGTGYPVYGTWDWPDALAGHETVIANPCPAGWRLPTAAELENVINNNTPANVPAATWSIGETVFSNLKKLGDDLMLPVAGFRLYNDGSLGNRSNIGYYWSNTSSDSLSGRSMYFSSGSPNLGKLDPGYGTSVRCVQAE